ncbi:uncharacterized protein MYCFIDRAFT_179248 [Pseudocercospora fijiensis CIRAD86]|uniref:Uncharacterized protein n=1 Tax=Pseudocercospora fijiensis (strain CIRAD86) TaxID=383855 RepID=M2YJ65_PSEFD|nr:uncharacterized protein MYCFIDRAFT_179248 [Pseudocercospora fijiensis CIRAD86]EME77755.1 hypothetical protein MYCFIDRAFT_179248 [Pseudocercospora fijiensis CIRAD86]
MIWTWSSATYGRAPGIRITEKRSQAYICLEFDVSLPFTCSSLRGCDLGTKLGGLNNPGEVKLDSGAKIHMSSLRTSHGLHNPFTVDGSESFQYIYSTRHMSLQRIKESRHSSREGVRKPATMNKYEHPKALRSDLSLDDAIINARDAGTEWQYLFIGAQLEEPLWLPADDPQIRPELLATFWNDSEVRMHFGFPIDEHVSTEHVDEEPADCPPEVERARHDEMLMTMGALAENLPEKESLEPTTNEQKLPATTAQPMSFTLAVRPKPQSGSRKHVGCATYSLISMGLQSSVDRYQTLNTGTVLIPLLRPRKSPDIGTVLYFFSGSPSLALFIFSHLVLVKRPGSSIATSIYFLASLYKSLAPHNCAIHCWNPGRNSKGQKIMERGAQMSDYGLPYRKMHEDASSQRLPESSGNLLKPVSSVDEDGIDMNVSKHISTFPSMSELKAALPKVQPETEDDTRMLEAPAESCPHGRSQLCNGCSARNSCSECHAPILASLAPNSTSTSARNVSQAASPIPKKHMSVAVKAFAIQALIQSRSEGLQGNHGGASQRRLHKRIAKRMSLPDFDSLMPLRSTVVMRTEGNSAARPYTLINETRPFNAARIVSPPSLLMITMIPIRLNHLAPGTLIGSASTRGCSVCWKIEQALFFQSLPGLGESRQSFHTSGHKYHHDRASLGIDTKKSNIMSQAYQCRIQWEVPDELETFHPDWPTTNWSLESDITLKQLLEKLKQEISQKLERCDEFSKKGISNFMTQLTEQINKGKDSSAQAAKSTFWLIRFRTTLNDKHNLDSGIWLRFSKLSDIIRTPCQVGVRVQLELEECQRGLSPIRPLLASARKGLNTKGHFRTAGISNSARNAKYINLIAQIIKNEMYTTL